MIVEETEQKTQNRQHTDPRYKVLIHKSKQHGLGIRVKNSGMELSSTFATHRDETKLGILFQ